MTLHRIAAVAVLTLLVGAARTSAQEMRGFASAGYTSDLNDPC